MKRFQILLSNMVFLIISFPAHAQETTPEAPADPVTPVVEPGFISGLIDFFSDPKVFGGLIVTIVGGILVFSIQEVIKRRNYVPKSDVPDIERTAVQRFIERLRQPQQLEDNHIRSSTLIAGIGGAGKTRLVNRLFADDTADSQIATKRFKRYQSASVIKSKRQDHVVTFNVADYAGQDFGTLIEGFIKEQSEQNTPFRHGYITSLILVADIFWPPKSNNEPRTLSEDNKIEMDRVQRNMEEWSDTALDALFGMASGEELGFICLFINKVDLLKTYNSAEILAAYDGLLQRLQKRGRGAEVVAIIGSADDGKGLVQVKEGLQRSAVPHI